MDMAWMCKKNRYAVSLHLGLGGVPGRQSHGGLQRRRSAAGNPKLSAITRFVRIMSITRRCCEAHSGSWSSSRRTGVGVGMYGTSACSICMSTTFTCPNGTPRPFGPLSTCLGVSEGLDGKTARTASSCSACIIPSPRRNSISAAPTNCSSTPSRSVEGALCAGAALGVASCAAAGGAWHGSSRAAPARALRAQ